MCIYFGSCLFNIAVGLILITMNTTDPAKSIPAFYAGQSIFLTGATGFLGKVIIEKILRCCPDVREIFLLIRPRRGLNINERLEKILNLPLFGKLRKERPENFKKLIPIFGDISKEGLGLSAVDKQMLIERVTIVLHTAASVKFNDTLKYAILTNTRTTRDICILAQDMKNLIVLVYVGTAYTNANSVNTVEEKVYPPIADWRKMIEIAESLDEQVLNIFTIKCLDNITNTYVYSKNLSESVIQEYSSTLPCAIVRPSMVMPSVEDPFPGWTDNVYGPFGFILAILKGVSRVNYVSTYKCADMVPVDIVVKAILVLTWKFGLTSFIPDSTPFVLNATAQKTVSFYKFCQTALEVGKEVPMEGIIWTPTLKFVESYVIFYVTTLFNMLPAILVDLILKLLRRQPMLVKLQRDVYVANCIMKHYMLHEFKFNNANGLALMSSILPDDRKTFSFDNSTMDFRSYIRDGCIIGGKKFIFHEDMNRLHIAKAHYKRMNLFVTILKTIIAVGILWIIYKNVCF